MVDWEWLKKRKTGVLRGFEYQWSLSTTILHESLCENSTVPIFPLKSSYLPSNFPQLIAQAKSRGRIGLIFSNTGKNPGFSSKPMIFRKNPGFSPTSREQPRFTFKPEKFVGFRSLGFVCTSTLGSLTLFVLTSCWWECACVQYVSCIYVLNKQRFLWGTTWPSSRAWPRTRKEQPGCKTI